MKKHMRLLIISLLLALLSGCYPVYDPMDGGHHRHGGDYDHDYDHGDRHGDRY